MFKKISFFIVLIYLSGLVSIALSEIIPLKKPLQTKEETKKKIASRCIEATTQAYK